MRVCLQRVKTASVTVDGETIGRIGNGLCLLLGFKADDTEDQIDPMAKKIAELRIFEDDDAKMNRSLLDVGGAALVVSQFTLYADTRKGRRPSFTGAMEPGTAERFYLRFCDALRTLGVTVETGRFGAKMLVTIDNWGPVTLILDG